MLAGVVGVSAFLSVTMSQTLDTSFTLLIKCVVGVRCRLLLSHSGSVSGIFCFLIGLSQVFSAFLLVSVGCFLLSYWSESGVFCFPIGQCRVSSAFS